MNRHTPPILGLVASLAGAVVAPAKVVPVPQTVAPEKIKGAQPRNVVFILSDDHRYDAMGFMGHPFAKTPHMDAMAKNGVHLKNAFVSTSLCSPSRASILTGLYTFRHRVIDNQRPVPQGTVFFPQYLQKAGYATAFIGKWHMGHAFDGPRPGFDHWVSFKGQGKYYPQTPTHFSLRGDRYKYTTYYGVWDTDELFDIQTDPMEQTNLVHDAAFAETKTEMQRRLYEMMGELGGMEIPMNPPRGRQQNKRLRGRGGPQAAEFPEAFIVDEPLWKELR